MHNERVYLYYCSILPNHKGILSHNQQVHCHISQREMIFCSLFFFFFILWWSWFITFTLALFFFYFTAAEHFARSYSLFFLRKTKQNKTLVIRFLKCVSDPSEYIYTKMIWHRLTQFQWTGYNLSHTKLCLYSSFKFVRLAVSVKTWWMSKFNTMMPRHHLFCYNEHAEEKVK